MQSPTGYSILLLIWLFIALQVSYRPENCFFVNEHQKSAESYQKRSNTKWKYWLDEWVDTQITKSKELEDLDLSSKTKPKDETLNKTPRNSSPRRLANNHRRQVSMGEEEPQNPGAVTTPTYMVATESAKAKSRSSSSPKIRPRSFDTQSESYSPYKNKLCLTTSVMSEAPSKVRIANNGNNTRPSAYQQRSPGLRGFSIGPLKSCNSTLLNDLSINSERSLPSWNKQSSLRWVDFEPCIYIHTFQCHLLEGHNSHVYQIKSSFFFVHTCLFHSISFGSLHNDKVNRDIVIWLSVQDNIK